MKTINFTEIAREKTASSAELKDWRVRTNHNKAMRELARSIKDKGYIIASPKELHNTYGNLYKYEPTAHGNDVRLVWAICDNKSWGRNGQAALIFAPICKLEEL